jgi:hypothetical protein
MRTKEELLKEIDWLIGRYQCLEKAEEAQRHILCNKWKMYWFLLEVREVLNEESKDS